MTVTRTALVLILACILPALGQEAKWSMHVGGWLGSSGERGDLPALGGSRECGVETAGSGSSWGLNGGMTTPAFIAGLRARLTIGYTGHERALRGPATDSLAVRTDASAIATASHSFSHSIKGSAIEAVAAVDAGLWPALLSLGVGLGARFDVATSVEARDVIDPGSTLRFPGGGLETVLFDATAIEARPIVPFASVTLRAAVPIGAQLSLVPWLAAQLTLGSVLNTYDWTVTEVGGGLGLEFDLGDVPGESPDASSPQPEATDPTIPADAAPPPIPAPTLALHAIDDAGHERDTALLFTRARSIALMAPMPAAITFPTGAAALGPLEYRDTSLESLLETKLEGAGALPFIAHELAQANGRVLTLAGSITKGEPRTLAARRARYVREALLALGATEGSVVVDSLRVLREGPKVLLRSSTPMWLSASTTQVEHRYPRIVVECTTPLSNREISLSIAGRIMGTISEVNGRARLGWTGGELATMNWTHLTARLPSRGDTPSAAASIPIQIRRSSLSLSDSNTSAGRWRVRLTVRMGFGDSITAGDSAMVAGFLSRVPSMARVLSNEAGSVREIPHTMEAIIGAVRWRTEAVVEAEVGG